MNIQKINSQSFCGITKMVTICIPTTKRNLNSISLNIQNATCKTIKKDSFIPSKKAKSFSLAKMTQFFNKDNIVGTHIEFANGSYSGTRKFADGTKLSYSATNLGNGFFVAGTQIKAPWGSGHISHAAYDKKGKPAIPTLKMIKELYHPKSVEKRIREGKLKDITNLPL